MGDNASTDGSAERVRNEVPDVELLAGHGVFVLGKSIRAVHQRAVALEQRCRHSWHVKAAGAALDTPLPQSHLDRTRQSDGNSFAGFWEAMVRQELREDPTILGDR